AQARRLLRTPRLGALGDQPRPHALAGRRAGRRRHRRTAQGPRRGRAARAVLALARGAARRRPRGRGRRARAAGRGGAPDRDRRDAQSVDLYLLESFTFRVATAEAAVALSP